MILLWLIVIPMIAGTLAWMAGKGNSRLPRVISLLALLVELALTCMVWARSGAAWARAAGRDERTKAEASRQARNGEKSMEKC